MFRVSQFGTCYFFSVCVVGWTVTPASTCTDKTRATQSERHTQKHAFDPNYIYIYISSIFFMSRLCQVIVAGKLRAQRAKAMKFRDGYMIKSGRVREGGFLIATLEFSFCKVMLVMNSPCVFREEEGSLSDISSGSKTSTATTRSSGCTQNVHALRFPVAVKASIMEHSVRWKCACIVSIIALSSPVALLSLPLPRNIDGSYRLRGPRCAPRYDAPRGARRDGVYHASPRPHRECGAFYV